MTKSLTWSTLGLVLLAVFSRRVHDGAPEVAAQAKPIVWNLPHISAPTYYHTINYTAFGSKVKEKSRRAHGDPLPRRPPRSTRGPS